MALLTLKCVHFKLPLLIILSLPPTINDDKGNMIVAATALFNI